MEKVKVVLVSWDMRIPVGVEELNVADVKYVRDYVGGNVGIVRVDAKFPNGQAAVMVANINGHFLGLNTNPRATALLSAYSVPIPHGFVYGNAIFIGLDDHGLYTDCPVLIASELVVAEVNTSHNMSLTSNVHRTA